jgi:hypothetical protein
MAKKLQHGATSKRIIEISREDGKLLDNLPDDLQQLHENQRKLDANNRHLLHLLNTKQNSEIIQKLPQFKGSSYEDFMIWFEDFKLPFIKQALQKKIN